MTEIPIDTHLEMFAEHLAINERAILSAKFGDGKTYFLNKFKEKYSKEGYYFITLYPVNYSVAENADVFEYIKRDIIIQLAEDDILSNIDFEKIATSICSWENAKELITYLLTFLPAGNFYAKLLEKGEAFIKKYEEKKETYKKFLTNIELQKGSIYEHDAYTKMIEEAIAYIQRRLDKKTVLIIEDLDRIDPAHLFRILNVLGAHLDYKYKENSSSSNKFGFNNIITVFDYDITEHIFHHFYGEKANYHGYINKFKVHQPFHFSIIDVAREFLLKYIEEWCYISPNTIKGCTSKYQLYWLIEKLSVRDIALLMSDIEEQIHDKDIKCYNPSNLFSSRSSLTIFIVILLRIGLNRFQIREYIIDNIPSIEQLNLFGVFFMTDSWFYNQSVIKYRKEDYRIIKEESSGKFIFVHFTKAKELYNSSSIYEDISTTIEHTIDDALSYVKD